jgi:hypothetical protein
MLEKISLPLVLSRGLCHTDWISPKKVFLSMVRIVLRLSRKSRNYIIPHCQQMYFNTTSTPPLPPQLPDWEVKR